MEVIEIIKENILNDAKENNLKVTSNIDRIAKAKSKFFSLEEWYRCPCYGKDDTIHGCGKEACLNTIKENGICHCKLFERIDE